MRLSEERVSLRLGQIMDPILVIDADGSWIGENEAGGTNLRFSVSPPLPNGICLDSRTGMIFGRALQVVADETSYVITARNDLGEALLHLKMGYASRVCFCACNLSADCQPYHTSQIPLLPSHTLTHAIKHTVFSTCRPNSGMHIRTPCTPWGRGKCTTAENRCCERSSITGCRFRPRLLILSSVCAHG